MKQTPNYIKGVVLFSILVLPSLLYLYLTAGKHNFLYLPTIADEAQNYVALVEENRREQPKHHYIRDFRLNEEYSFKDLDDNIKLIFISRAEETLNNQLIAYMFETEVWEHLGNYENIYFLNFVIEDSTHIFDASIFEENSIPKDQWINIPLSIDSLNSIMKDNVWVGEIADKMYTGEELNIAEVIISDKEGRMRTGFDNNDIVMYSYNNLSKFEIKLLRDDLKVLLAEYQRELKKKND
jgi:hypothetical protein